MKRRSSRRPHPGRMAEDSVAVSLAALQYGDNEAVFTAVLNNMRARASGMRTLVKQRDAYERRHNRLLSTAHVRREQNTEADALANLDIDKFRELISDRIHDATLIQLEVPRKVADLGPLLESSEH